MPKEWILNIATNRWGLNKKNKVGPVAEWIRDVEPKTKEEWKNAYLKRLDETIIKNDRRIRNLTPEDYLVEIGKKLYIKISEVMQAEIDEITEEDCIEYLSSNL